MVEGRDHRSGDSFLMTGGDDHRGPDMYLTWDPVIHEDRRRADQDFIAHARQDIPALAAEIRRLREQLLRPLVADEMATYEMIQATNAASGTSQIAQLIKNVLDRPGLYLMGRSLKDYANIVTGQPALPAWTGRPSTDGLNVRFSTGATPEPGRLAWIELSSARRSILFPSAVSRIQT